MPVFLDALPDGSTFELKVFSIQELYFTKKPVRTAASTRRRAKAWFNKLQPLGYHLTRHENVCTPLKFDKHNRQTDAGG